MGTILVICIVGLIFTYVAENTDSIGNFIDAFIKFNSNR